MLANRKSCREWEYEMTTSGHIDSGALLAECALFAGAAEVDIKALAAIATTSSWPAGAMIFQQGDPAEFLIIIASGRIRLGLTTAGGKELTLRHAAPGAVVVPLKLLQLVAVVCVKLTAFCTTRLTPPPTVNLSVAFKSMPAAPCWLRLPLMTSLELSASAVTLTVSLIL